MHRLRPTVWLLPWSLVIACAPQSAPGAPSVVAEAVGIRPASAVADPGTTVQFSAEIRRSDGTTGPATARWTSSSPTVARVDQEGTVTALEGGEVTISAAVGSDVGRATLVVRDLYDPDVRGYSPFITHDYLDLAGVAQVSRFRSAIGHDYSDEVERCRSMKHYFLPRPGTDWSQLEVRAPAAGTIVGLHTETTFGTQLRLRPHALTAATVVIFHVVPEGGMAVGTTVAGGQRLGHHVGTQTMSDIAIEFSTPRGRRLASYFDVMSDAVFAGYLGRGVANRAELIISRTERDAAPLSCDGERFTEADPVEGWVVLP